MTGQAWIRSEISPEGVYIVIEEGETRKPLAHVFLRRRSALRVAWQMILNAMRAKP